MREMCRIVDTRVEKALMETQGDKKADAGGEKKVMCHKVLCKIVPDKEEMPIEEVVTYIRNINSSKTENKLCVGNGENTNLPLVHNYQHTLYPVTSVNGHLDSVNSISYTEMVPAEFQHNRGDFHTNIAGKSFFDNQEFMNCSVCIDSILYDGNRTYYECSVFIKGKVVRKKVEAGKFADGGWLKNIPGFAISCDRAKASNLMYIYLNQLIDNAPNFVTELTKKPGWVMLEKSGVYVYITPNGPIGNVSCMIKSECGQTFEGSLYGSNGNLASFLEMMNLTKTPTASILLLYTVMSFSYSLFKDAGLMPKFSIFLHGPRGSFKTSLALAMTQVEKTDSPRFSLKSTTAGIEAGYKYYKDAVMLIDDLAPTDDFNERKRMQYNVETVVRAVGDGNGKMRNYDFIDSKSAPEQYTAEGGVVITGEYTAGCESSLARSLFLALKREDVNQELLTKYQEEKFRLQTFLVEYILFLGRESQRVISFITDKGKELRNKYKNCFTNPRYGEYMSQLLVTAELLMVYSKASGQLSEVEALRYLEIFQNHITYTIDCNNREIIEETPASKICCALVAGIDQHILPIVPLGYKLEQSQHAIIETEDFYYIRQEDARMIKNQYDSLNGFKGIDLSTTMIAKHLADAGVIKEYKEGNDRPRKARKLPGYGNTRYMEVNKQKLMEIAKL